MRYRFNGLSGFGKGYMSPPPGPPAGAPPTAPQGSWQHQKQLMEMKHKHEMEMMKMKLELARMQRAGVAVPATLKRDTAQASAAVKAVGAGTSTGAATVLASDVAALKTQIETLKRKEQVAASGGAVVGAKGKSVEELLVGKDTSSSHQRFTPSTAKKGLKWNDWRKLKTRLPANFNEAKYLANNPGVAAGVKRGQFPSGAWHYVMYGAPNCAYGEKHGGHCSKKFANTFLGLGGAHRRPGYLSGIFANWSQRD
jgi:hypothetical protein